MKLQVFMFNNFQILSEGVVDTDKPLDEMVATLNRLDAEAVLNQDSLSVCLGRVTVMGAMQARPQVVDYWNVYKFVDGNMVFIGDFVGSPVSILTMMILFYSLVPKNSLGGAE